MTPRICGLDISLTATGIADNTGRTATEGVDGVTKLPLHDRARSIEMLAHDVLVHVGAPSLVVVEQTAFSKAYGGAAERAGLWWLIVTLLRSNRVPVAEVKATTLKRYALGRGSGGKGAVIEAVTRRFPRYETGGDDNVCDAIVLAAMGADHLGCPLASMPASHRAALDAVAWPEVTA